MSPFSYPKAKHARTQQPPTFNSYPRYKPYLQREFSAQCVYCRIPDALKGYEAFHVEHYRPQKSFPELECAYENLFYSCGNCNRSKGSYWPQAHEEKTRFIPNPCDHVMFEHLRFVDGDVMARTEAGQFAVERLDLNDPNAVEFRRFTKDQIDITGRAIAELDRLTLQLRKRFSRGQVTEARLCEGVERLAAKKATYEGNLRKLTGEAWAAP